LEKPVLAPARPKCNSLLHLFGKWLFEAAFIDTEYEVDPKAQKTATGTAPPDKKPASGAATTPSASQPSDQRRMSGAAATAAAAAATASSAEALELPSALTPDRFESGRAEALGTLCRIFCSKKTGEDIMPIYLARFYLAVQQGLAVPSVCLAFGMMAASLNVVGSMLLFPRTK
jgi:hypothetical protein